MTPSQSPFEIRHTKGNKSGSLPSHWDIYLRGQDDSIITVWEGLDLAEYIGFCMNAYGKWKACVYPANKAPVTDSDA